MNPSPPKNLLLVDIGNSRTTFARSVSGTIEPTFSVETSESLSDRVPSDREILLGSISPDEIRLVSVVPQATLRLRTLLERLFSGVTIRIITHEMVSMVSLYEPSASLGIDRLLASFGAWKIFGEPQQKGVIAVDLGTATTFNCVKSEGVFLGGAISLGIRSTLEALSEKTAQLPKAELEFPRTVLARTTEQSIRSGVLWGGISAIEGMIDALKVEAFPNSMPLVILTGGLSELMAPHLTGIDHLRPNLLLESLAMLP